ncbi:protein Smaug homolog 1-like isoform X1 [Daphnia pulex]|uniref:protein Smaug homolog 1-like isoform X1 n=1 Tax=Daphnia pulex TaxID=6669 RepID=UPI001EDE93DC|nr:protein Smaug homolog 1-like isoform X1 [Daphnia pulex]XP_046437499.1 protein Smaug homolog 1-like isoform X1 [Daphnia pulex]
MVMAPQPPREFTVEELEPLETWFESCNGAQQATIAVKLLSRANPKAAHLIHSFLQQQLLVANAIWRQEIQRANDPAFLNGLRNESRDVAVSQLLHYLPLLRPANSDGVRGYIHLLPGLLASFLEDDPNQGPSPSSAQHQSTEIQQLLTYALIHPALSLESKRSLAELIRQLDDEGNQDMALSLLESNHQGGLDMFPPSDPQSPDAFHSQATRQRPHNGVGQWDPWSSPSPAGLGPPTKQPPPSSCTIQRIRRSNSLTPPSNSMVYPQDPWGSNQNDNGRIKPRSLSLSSPSETTNGLSHCPLSPQNSLASSGSGSGSDSIYSDDNHRPSSFHIPGSGMRDVPSWLKGLRLHKYAHLFSLLTYDEMLALTEEQLELQGVTKGARHKIALSILRLRERPTLLAQLEKEVVDTGSLHNALSELKNLLSTPIKPYRGPPVADDQLFIGNLSPSPSPLMTRDDTSGYSSLDGSMDNLAAARGLSTGSPTALETSDLSKPPPASPPSTIGQSSRSTLTASDMPTVIVSAAPDVDSAEEGSDTSADDGLGDNLSSGNFRSAFGNELELLGGPTHLSLDDLPGQITRLLGKICTQLLVSSCPAEDNVSQFVALMDRCLSHEAFTQRQRRRIASWKEQAHRIWNNLAPSASAAGLGNGTAPGSRGSNNSAIVNATNGGVVGSGGPQKSSEARFARRWSNVAHYPGFYSADGAGSSAAQTSFGCAPPNAYSLFPPRQQQQQQQRGIHASPCPSPSLARPLFAGQSPTHNSYGQHTHHAGGVNAAQMRPGPAPTTTSPHNNPHSLQVGSHLPLQHRNSFCVSALSHQSSLYSSTSSSCTSSSQGYSSLSCGVAAPDPFTFSPPHRMHFDELPSESLPFASQLGIQRARSAPMANGGVINNSSLLFSQERDASEMDLNHRLESLCLSMTEHALEGANDI